MTRKRHLVTKVIAGGLTLAGVLANQIAAEEAGLRGVQQDQFVSAAEKTVEAQNRDLIIRLYFQFFNSHDVNFANKVIDENFIQHNPAIPTGRQPVVDFLQSLFQQFPNSHWNIDHIAAGGDLVWLQVHQTNDAQDLGSEIMDIYRIKDGVIVEHWDAGEAVSAKSANSNTQF